jgi:hypothetical protein
MLIDIEEVKTMVNKHLPGFAAKHPGVQLLIQFVGKTVHAVNNLDERLKRVERSLNADSKSE